MEIAIIVLAAVLVSVCLVAVLAVPRLVRKGRAAVKPESAEQGSRADAERASLSAQLAASQQAAADAREVAARAQEATLLTRDMLSAAQSEVAEFRALAVSAQTEAAASQARVDALSQSRSDDALRHTEEAARLGARVARALETEIRLGERETRLTERDERLTTREGRLTVEADRLARDQSELAGLRSALDQRAAALAEADSRIQAELERVAGLTADAATHELISGIEASAKRKAALSVRDIEADAKRTADARAREVVSQAVQRVASAQTTESVIAVVHLPGDDMKGRIIGREGRNIRTFETITGVNVLIDDTPEAVTLSCFDPVRREVARVALEALVADGRIHPQRIEDAYALAKDEVEATMAVAGQDALLEVGLGDAHPDLVTLLGRLRYRTSYGQNVLRHLVETAHIASGMAAELGLGRDGIEIVKRAAFFHDIGKALTHEVEGSHALVGADVAKRCGESGDVVHAIAAHHLEVAPQTVEAWLTIGSDSCSGGRPGARRESLESYVDRLSRIEEIAMSRDGVERVFAMSAGRELRVMVLPDEVDDLGASVLARDIAKQIEDELTYPGQIKVTVVRESRAIETAH